MAIGTAGDSMEDGADIIQVTLSSSSTVDMWAVQSHGDGFSHVVNVNSARSEHWVGSQQAQGGANLIQWPVGEGINDVFCFHDIGNGHYSILVKHSRQDLILTFLVQVWTMGPVFFSGSVHQMKTSNSAWLKWPSDYEATNDNCCLADQGDRSYAILAELSGMATKLVFR